MIFAPPPPLPRYVDVNVEPPPVEAPPAPASGTSIAQLGAYSTRTRAEEALLVVQLSAAPQSLPTHVRPEPSRGRTRFRLVAGPLDAASADRLCVRLHAVHEPCAVIDTASPPRDQGTPEGDRRAEGR